MFSAQNSQVSNNVNYVEDVFSTYLYTGNNTNPRTITNGIDLVGKGGLVWTKNRNNTEPHILVDTVRGSGKNLSSNNTNAQDVTGSLTAFTSSGYTISNQTVVNGIDTYTYVSWTFREQPKFFDVVTYTGDGTAGRTVAHNLGSVPGCIMVKNISRATDWIVYHRSIGATGALYLNTSTATVTATSFWNNTSPTSTQFTTGTWTGTNYSGDTFVAYLFAHNAGGFGLTGTDNVISCGTFTTDGTGAAGNITLGYESQWVMFKRTDGVGNWQIVDTMRGSSLNSYNYISPTVSSAESSSTSTQGIYPTATGFYVGNNFPGASQTYVYIAIRRGPMKVPTLGTSVYNAIARTGTGATANVTGVGFPPDLVIPTARTVGWQRGWYDRLRGANKSIASNDTGAELTTADSITAFGQDGATYGTEVSVNASTYTFANWFMRRAPGFFDEVCYTGTGSLTTKNHNLNAVPELMIIKGRNSAFARSWIVYHAALGNTQYMVMNNTSLPVASITAWNNTTPTNSVFTINDLGSVNYDASETYVAYLFATCTGVSKVGSYTGNGSSQTISCGFAAGARFILIRRTDSTGDWYVWDTARGIVSGNDPHLSLNTTAAEVTTDDTIDPDNSGFIVNQVAATNVNVSSATYIFLAIA